MEKAYAQWRMTRGLISLDEFVCTKKSENINPEIWLASENIRGEHVYWLVCSRSLTLHDRGNESCIRQVSV